MKAVILAGGKGTRLRQVVKDLPKPMAMISGRPFLEYLILQLAKVGITDIILSLGYKKEAVKSYFGSGKPWKVNIGYCEERTPLGTGGALKKAAGLINSREFLVMNGDSCLDLNFNRLISFHHRHKAICSIVLATVADTSRYARVKVNKANEVSSFREKKSGGSGLINGGVYVFDRGIVDYIPGGRVSLEYQVLPRLIGRGLRAMVVKGFFIDIGVPEAFSGLNNKPQRLFKAAGI